MLFRKWAERTAASLGESAGIQDDYQIALIRYTFEGLYSMILSVTVLVIVAFALGMMKTLLLIALTGAFLKSFTGGLHANTPLRCAIGGALVLIPIGYLARYVTLPEIPIFLTIGLLLLGNVIVWLKAPREAKGKPLTDQQKKTLGLLSKIVFGLMSVVCILWPSTWGFTEMFYGMIFQSLNLLDITAKFVGWLDGVLGLIERKQVF